MQATGHTVRLEVSIDNGATWNLVADGVPASLGGINWNSQSLPSSPLALWRVQDEQETNVVAVSELNFVLHNGPIHYYVNDDSTAGDIYCSALGVSSNTGVSADSPKRWVSEILDTYNLEPGDVVHVDTGIYQTSDPTVVGDLDAGGISQDPSQQVTLLGSTNVLAGGTTFILSSPDVSGFLLTNTYGVRLETSECGLCQQRRLHSKLLLHCRRMAEHPQLQGWRGGELLLQHRLVPLGDGREQQRGHSFFSESKGPLGSGVQPAVVEPVRHPAGTGICPGLQFDLSACCRANSFGYYVLVTAPETVAQGDYNSMYLWHTDSDGNLDSAAGGLQTG